MHWTASAPGAAVVHRFMLSTPELAACFASKVLSDFAQTPGNSVRAAAADDFAVLKSNPERRAQVEAA